MKTPSIPAKTLAIGILSTDYTFILNNILRWDGVNLSSADFDPVGYGVLFNASRTQAEFFTFDPATIANTPITILTRGNDYVGGTADGVATKFDWNANETYVMIGSNPPALFSNFLNLNNVPQTVQGLITFNQTPIGLNPGAVQDASTSTKGITKLTAAPATTIGTFTVTIASPAVFTLNSHGLLVGDNVQLTTTGALPTGLAISTTYYVIAAGLTSNAFELSATLGGTAITTTGTQSGTHTLIETTPFAVSRDDVILVGSSGAKLSSTNHPVDNSDTSGTGAVVRLSLLTSGLLPGFYGDGSDSALVFDGIATILGMVPSTNVYTLSRDIYGTNITINAGITILTNGYKIFAQGTLSNAGIISNNGNNGGNGTNGTAGTGGTGGSAGGAPAANSVIPGVAGSTGGTASSSANAAGVNGSAGTAKSNVVGVAGGVGGAGGTTTGNGTNAGGLGGTIGALTAAVSTIRDIVTAFMLQNVTGVFNIGTAGTGAGSGANNNSSGGNNAGGGGGGGGSTGGMVFIAAQTLTGAGVVNAKGGNGGNGGNGFAGTGNSGSSGGGTGGGGAGGVVVIITSTVANPYTTSVAGGAAGVTVGTGATSGVGFTAASGIAGSAGNTGKIFYLII